MARAPAGGSKPYYQIVREVLSANVATGSLPVGTIHVSDGYAKHKTHRFAPDGTLLGSFGEFGDGPGELMTLRAVVVRGDGRVAVVDRENGHPQVFSPEGALLDIWCSFVKPLDVRGDAKERALSSSPSRVTRLAPLADPT